MEIKGYPARDRPYALTIISFLSLHRVKHVFISNLILTFGSTKPTVKPVTVTIIFIVPCVGLALPNVMTKRKLTIKP